MNSIEKKAVRTAALSVFSNTILTILKLVVGIMIGSVAIISEAVHSAIDLIAALIALFAVKTSAKPADDEHPYGHGKVENISGTIEALLIFVAAGYIIYESVNRLMNPQPVESPLIGVFVMLFASVVNYFVAMRLFKVAKEADSIALEADGWHLLTDVYTSLGVMAALAVMVIIEFVSPGKNIHWIDPVAALIVAAMIIKAAYTLTIKSAKDLFDVSLSQEEIALVENIIRSYKDTISGYHDLKTRKAGNKCFVEVHILVNPEMTVLQSHEITREIDGSIAEKLKNVFVTIHVEPCDDTCTPKCQTGCLTKFFKENK
ncbi:MAG: cation diffusion facilitator family transporter [Endomicrobia bacterium]|nr:cation diffusion facilitator family transporter [Endomicrobiia bacterium]MCL2506897.1 cation diffusion facilitator family transporter [Endomicrobiia bacterium]